MLQREHWAGLVTVLGVFLFAFLRACLRIHRYLSMLDALPGPKGYPIIGNLLLLNVYKTGVIPMIEGLIKFGPIVRARAFGVAHVIINDVKSLEKVLSSTHYIKKSTDYRFLEPWLQEGLLTSTGSKWHTRRKILTSAFHFKILGDYLPVLNRNSIILVEKLKEHIQEPFVKINSFITLCTLDIICETAMGTSINAQLGEEVEYVRSVQRDGLWSREESVPPAEELMESTPRRQAEPLHKYTRKLYATNMGRPQLWGHQCCSDFRRISELFQLRQLTFRLYSDLLFKFSSMGREQAKVLRILHGFSNKIIKQRRAEYKAKVNDPTKTDGRVSKRKHLAFLDLLIEISEKEQKMTDRDIQEEVDTFMFEGHDTTTSAICWTLYLLGMHPDIQERVVEELNGIFGDSDRSPSYDDLSSMKYLEQVIKETLRLYPSVPAYSRQLESDIELLGYTVPAGANVTVLPLFLHRDPKLYPDPDKFDPDRFSPEASQNRHPYSYLPFSAGPRSCIGQRFALMEEKVVLSTVLRNFRLESLDKPEDITLLMELILRPLEQLRIRFSPRWMPAEFYKHLHKIPGPKGYPVIGNTLIALSMGADDVYNFMKSFSEKYGSILRLYGFGRAHVMISDHEIIEAILTSTQNISKAVDYSFLSCWLRNGLLLSTGEKWHARRKMLTPAFHFKILEDYIPVFSRNSKILVNKLWEYIDEPFVRVNKLITLCTLDIICETAMGTSIHAQDGQEVEYVKAVQRITEIFQKRQLNPFLYKSIIFNMSGIGREQARVVKILHTFTRKVLKQRKEEYICKRETTDSNQQKKKRILSFLDLLIEMSETKQLLSDEDIQEEVDTFMFEGHDTTSSALSWTMYLLGSHPDIQEKVMDELNSIFGNSDRDPTYEDLSRMKYLEQVIKETLRLYPSVPVISRLVEKDIHIKGYTIPVGAHATILTFMLHRNPELYPEPEKFDPSRFSPEACQKRHPFAYVPFSAGPRSCIGQKFALMEEKVVLSTVLRNFKLESLDRPEDVKILMEIVLKPKKPFQIRFTPRK